MLYNDNEKKKDSNDIVIFDDVYIKLQSHETSLLSLRVTPKNKFKLMRPFISEIIKLDKNNE